MGIAGRSRVDGVSVAIGVITALSRSAEPIAFSDLLALAPRSSLYRVIGTLEAAGLVTRRKGRLSPGPLAAALLGAEARRLSAEPLPPALPRQSEGLDAGAANEPIALSRPRQRRSQRRGFRIGFSNISLDNPWRVTLVHSVERAAARLDGRIARFQVRHADNSAEAQAADIGELVESGVDGLIVSAAISPLVRKAIEAAMQRGVEVVMLDRGISDAAPTSIVCGSDRALGRITAQWLAETLHGQGGVLLLPGAEGAEPAQQRFAAARAMFASFPEIRVLDTAWTGWQRERGYRLASEAIKRFGSEISGVWCDSGLQGVGSMTAFIKSGWRNGSIPPHTGGDLNLAYKLAIKHQIRLAAVDYPPAMGSKAVEVLIEVLDGRYVPARVEVPLEVVLSKGAATPSVSPHLSVEERVRWDLPDDLVLASGLGRAYNPRAFRIHYRGNSYNRSAAQHARGRA